MKSDSGKTKDLEFYAVAFSFNRGDGPLSPVYGCMCIPNNGGRMPAPKVYSMSMYNKGDENQGLSNVDEVEMESDEDEDVRMMAFEAEDNWRTDTRPPRTTPIISVSC